VTEIILEYIVFALRWSGLWFFLGIVVSYLLWICTDTDRTSHFALKLSVTCGALLILWAAFWVWRGLLVSS